MTGATAAFKTGAWSSFTGPQRARCLHEFATLVEKDAARLARVESLATGRPIAGIQFFDIAHMVETIRCESATMSQAQELKVDIVFRLCGVGG